MVDIGHEFSHWTVILAEVVCDIVLFGRLSYSIQVVLIAVLVANISSELPPSIRRSCVLVLMVRVVVIHAFNQSKELILRFYSLLKFFTLFSPSNMQEEFLLSF